MVCKCLMINEDGDGKGFVNSFMYFLKEGEVERNEIFI